MKNCNCGSTEFLIFESVLYDANIEQGVLILDTTSKYEREIERVECKRCGTVVNDFRGEIG